MKLLEIFKSIFCQPAAVKARAPIPHRLPSVDKLIDRTAHIVAAGNLRRDLNAVISTEQEMLHVSYLLSTINTDQLPGLVEGDYIEMVTPSGFAFILLFNRKTNRGVNHFTYDGRYFVGFNLAGISLQRKGF